MTDAERTAQLEELAAAHRFLAVEGHEDRTSFCAFVVAAQPVLSA